jgi:hypothetical protein
MVVIFLCDWPPHDLIINLVLIEHTKPHVAWSSENLNLLFAKTQDRLPPGHNVQLRQYLD